MRFNTVNIGDFSHHRFLSKVGFAKKSEQNLSPIVSKKFILLLMCFAFHLARNGRMTFLQSWVNRFTFHGEHAKDSFVNPAQRFFPRKTFE